MRLAKSEIAAIKEAARKVWGSQTVVYLFGSRTDDTKKGGDIDLYIQLSAEPTPEKLILQRAEFLEKLVRTIGEQKIDLLIKTRYNKNSSIIKTAHSTGVEL